MSQASILTSIPGIEVMPDPADATHIPDMPDSYVTSYARGCLHWHTPNGDHYANVMQTNRLLANTADHEPPEDPNGIRGGQLIQPLPQPPELGTDPDMAPRANVVPDRDMTLVALIEFHDRAYWTSFCHALGQVLRGETQTAVLAPLTEDEFRRLF